VKHWWAFGGLLREFGGLLTRLWRECGETLVGFWQAFKGVGGLFDKTVAGVWWDIGGLLAGHLRGLLAWHLCLAVVGHVGGL